MIGDISEYGSMVLIMAWSVVIITLIVTAVFGRNGRVCG